MQLGDRFRRKVKSGKLSAGLGAVIAIVALAVSAVTALPGGFGRPDPFYIAQNKALLRHWLARPKSTFRNERVRALRENLRWAAEYEHTGVNPEFLTEVRRPNNPEGN